SSGTEFVLDVASPCSSREAAAASLTPSGFRCRGRHGRVSDAVRHLAVVDVYTGCLPEHLRVRAVSVVAQPPQTVDRRTRGDVRQHAWRLELRKRCAEPWNDLL